MPSALLQTTLAYTYKRLDSSHREDSGWQESCSSTQSLRKEKRKENEDGTGEGLFVGVGGDFRMRMVYMCMCVAEGGGECQGCKS